MRKLIALLAGLLLATNALAAPAYVGVSANGGQIPVPIPDYGQPSISSCAPSCGAATSAVLSTTWGGATASTYTLIFSNAAVATGVTLTNGMTSASWSSGAVAGATGQATVTGYIPGGAGNQVVFLPVSNGGGSLSFTMTGSASTPTVQTIGSGTGCTGGSNVTDGQGNTYGLWANLSVTSGNQYWTLTQPSSDYINPALFMYEFSGAPYLKNVVCTVTANPGAGAGAVLGAAVTVATGDILVVAAFDGSNLYNAATVNGPSGSTTINNYSGATTQYWTGTGVSITPTYTAPTGYTTGTFIVVQWVMSATTPGPTINSQPTQQTAAVGGTATFSVTATASAGSLTYQWYEAPPQALYPPVSQGLYTNVPNGWGSIVGATSSSYTTPTLSSSNTGQFYYCAVTDPNGTVNTLVARVWVTGLGPDARGLQ